MANWIFGRSIDSRNHCEYSNLEGFVGYLVHVGSPRCVMIVTDRDFWKRHNLSFTDEAGYYISNKRFQLEFVLTEWIDDPLADKDHLINLFYEAESHFLLDQLETRESEIGGELAAIG